jgi:aspartokinase-like uncharacterized kinase
MLDPLPTVDEFAQKLSERDNRLTPPPEIPFHILKVGSQRDMITSSKVIYLPDGRFTVHFKNHDDEDKITCSTAHEAARKCVEFIEKYYGDEPGEKTSLFISKRLEPVSNISRYMPT